MLSTNDIFENPEISANSYINILKQAERVITKVDRDERLVIEKQLRNLKKQEQKKKKKEDDRDRRKRIDAYAREQRAKDIRNSVLSLDSSSIDHTNERYLRRSHNKNATSNQKDKIKSCQRKLRKCKKAYEFGVEIDFRNDDSVRNYLCYLANWLDGINFPTNVQNLRAFVAREKNVHRALCWRMLAHSGSNRARLLVKCVDNTVTQRDIDMVDIVAQSDGHTTWYDIILALFSTLFVDGWKASRDLWTKLKDKLTSYGSEAKKVSADIFMKAREMGERAVQLAGELTAWVEAKVDECISYFQLLTGLQSSIIRFFLKIIVAIVVAGAVIVVIPAVGWALIKKFWLENDLKAEEELEVMVTTEKEKFEAQGFEAPDFVKPVLYIFADNFDVPRNFLIGQIGKLPKYASIGKALEWFVEKGGDVLTWCVEWWTGAPYARGTVENQINEFSNEVEVFKAMVKSFDIAIALSPMTLAKDDELRMKKNNIELAMRFVASKKAVRQFFLQKISVANSLYSSLHNDLEHIKKSAKARPVPVWVYITGEPGLGKSETARRLMPDIWDQMKRRGCLATQNRDFTLRDVFTIQQDEKYYDNYAHEYFTLIDDLFQTNNNDELRAMALALIGMCSPLPYSLKVADPAQKAGTFFDSRCIISTTNRTTGSLHGVSVGLVSLEALETRRTIMVEMKKKDNTYVYDLYPECEVEINGSKVKGLLYEDLVSVIVECLMQREKQCAVVTPLTVIPPVKVAYRGNRLSFQAQMMEGETADGKEKEKEHVPTVAVQAPSIEMWTEPDEPKAGEFGVQSEENVRMEIDTQIVITNAYKNGKSLPEPVQLMWDRSRPPFQYQFEWLDEWRYVVPENIAEFKVETFFEIMNIWTHKPTSHKWNALCTPIEGRSGRVFYPIYCGGGKIMMVNTEEDWKRLQSMRSLIKPVWKEGNQYSFKIYSDSERGPPLAFKALPVFVLRGLLRVDPSLVLPRFTMAMAPKDGNNWQEIMRAWLLETRGYTIEETQKHAQVIDGYELPTNVVEFAALFETVHNGTWTTPVMVAVSLLGAVALFAILAKAASFLFPGAIYKEPTYEPQGYPGSAAGKNPKPKIIRTKGRNVNRLKTLKQRDANAVAVAQMKHRNDSEIYRMIDRNIEIMEVRVVPKGTSRDEILTFPALTGCYILFIGGNTALCPLHTMVAKGEISDNVDRYITLHRQGKYIFHFDELVFEKFADGEDDKGDVAIVTFSGVAPKTNIVKHFAEAPPTRGSIDRLRPFVEKSAYSLDHSSVYKFELNKITIPDYEPFVTDFEVHSMVNHAGMCGIPYLSNASGKIFAIHMAGSRHTQISLGVVILRSDLKEWETKPTIAPPTTITFEASMAKEGIMVLGRCDPKYGTNIPSQTNLERSGFSMDGFPFPETDSAPALLRPKDGIFPAQNAFEKIQRQYYPRVPRFIDTDVMGFVPKTFMKANIRMLNIFEAIHGIPGYISALDKTTSVGYSYKKLGLTRNDLFFVDGKPGVHPILKANVEFKLKRIDEGVWTPAIFEDTLKDELRDGERVRLGKTRLFAAGDLDTLIIQRMILGTIIQELESDPVGSPCGLGLNPHSSDWGRLLDRLEGPTEELLNVCIGDFSDYDFSEKNEGVLKFDELCRKVSQDTDILPHRVTAALWMSFLGWHVYGMLWFLRPFGNNSGSYITSIYNTFYNWFIHKTAFIALYPADDYDRVVRGTFTGDDSVVATSKERFPKYNMEWLKAFFKDEYGMTYTSGMKDDRMNLTLDDLIYLKRRFVRQKQGLMAPLDPRSMYDMVAWSTKGANREIAQSVLNSLQLEAFHYGKDIYDLVYDWAAKQTWMGGNFGLLSYGDMARKRAGDYL